MKIQKKKLGEAGQVGQDGCGRRIKVFVKLQKKVIVKIKKKKIGGGGGGGGGVRWEGRVVRVDLNKELKFL